MKGELSDVGKFVLGALERMELGPFTIGESEEDELRILEVSGDAGRSLVENDPRAIDALQLLAHQMAVAAVDDDEKVKRIVVDIEGEGDQREDFLTSLAQRIAKRALDTGRSVALDPMNGRDRRIIHVALRDEDGVATMSRGEGRYRQVVVVPEDAPEYDEAVKASSDSR